MKYNKPLYEIILYLTEDDRHSPYVVRGLLDLEKDGFITLIFRSMPIIFKNRYHLSNGKFMLQGKGYPWCPEIEIVDIRVAKVSKPLGKLDGARIGAARIARCVSQILHLLTAC